MMEPFIITPRTKIYDLLEAYPQLEDLLIQLAPVFRKLKNPVLRRTITRVTSLQQAAAVGNLPVYELVNALRLSVGQDRLEGTEDDDGGDKTRPGWLMENRIVMRMDARPVIEKGGHPLGDVLSGIQSMHAGEVYELITPFLPAPLIEKVASQGFDTWSEKESEDCFLNYFCKK